MRGTLTSALATVIRSGRLSFLFGFVYFGLSLKVLLVDQAWQVRRQDYFTQFGILYASANNFKRIVHKFNLSVLRLFGHGRENQKN